MQSRNQYSNLTAGNLFSKEPDSKCFRMYSPLVSVDKWISLVFL